MILIKEDFSDFTTSEYPYDKAHTALGEYHHFSHPGYKGNFYDTISLHQWRSLDGSWMITEDNGKHYLEQNRGDNTKEAFKNLYAVLTHKEILFSTYTVEFDLRMYEVSNYAGFAFNYVTAREYMFFGMKYGHIALLDRFQEDFKVLDEKNFELDDLKTYHIKIEVSDITKVYIDSVLMLSAKTGFKPKTRVAFVSKSQVAYSDLTVSMSDSKYKEHLINKEKEELRLKNKRKEYSELECIKKIDLKNFGSARQLRIARVDGKVYFLLAQHQKRYIRDSFAHLSSMTLFDLDGNIIWTKGEPNNSTDNTRISCDLPFQIADINNDGKLEVIYARNFEVIIIDLLTGNKLKSMPTPVIYNDPLVKNEPFYRLNVDAIRVLDFEGLGYPGDFIIKDRYQNVWGYNSKMENVWRYHNKNTGHFPYVVDYNNDGKDELLIGYDLVSSKGDIIWSLPMNSDHTDEIIYTKLKKDGAYHFVLASGNEGMNIVNTDGTIYKHNEVGHAQRVSVAKYDLNREGLQIMSTSFWGSDSIVEIFDCDGNRLKSMENGENGNVITPIMYDGVNTLALLHAGENGGLIDSSLDVVVSFPRDGHPELASEVYDIDGDGIDEILCWDEHTMYIYKAKSYVYPKKTYSKYTDTGFSNYRGEFLISVSDL